MASLKIRELQKKIGYKFKDQKNLVRALTHPTFSEEEKKKQLQFADAILTNLRLTVETWHTKSARKTVPIR